MIVYKFKGPESFWEWMVNKFGGKNVSSQLDVILKAVTDIKTDLDSSIAALNTIVAADQQSIQTLQTTIATLSTKIDVENVALVNMQKQIDQLWNAMFPTQAIEAVHKEPQPN